ncbi:MAG: NAD(P)-dependent oxidoreductase [Alphaproteobacteria bacterium]|nr:NAD(P)-dependent oxidoreductase [Alphaproteobacteria bacterium]
MSKHIGVVGLGIMGSAISGNFCKSGYQVTGYDISQERCDELAGKGGNIAGSPGEVAAAADIVLTSLPSSAALDAVVSGDGGIAATGNKAAPIMECSTLPIEDKQRNHDALAAAGITMLDSPLSGTGAQAVTKDLAVYLSGDESAANMCAEIIEGFARAHYYVGEFGNGSRMKYVANHLVAIHNVAAAEALVLGMKAGLDAQTIFDVISDSAGNSRMFEIRGPMMVADNYDDATMKIEVWQKDMGIIAAFAKSLACPVPMFSTTADIYTAGMAQGRATQDTGAVCAVLGEMARLKR